MHLLENIVPVSRAADYAKTGNGLIRIDSTDLTLIVGVGATKFKSQLMVKGQIVLPKNVGYAHAEVSEIIDDKHVR